MGIFYCIQMYRLIVYKLVDCCELLYTYTAYGFLGRYFIRNLIGFNERLIAIFDYTKVHFHNVSIDCSLSLQRKIGNDYSS